MTTPANFSQIMQAGSLEWRERGNIYPLVPGTPIEAKSIANTLGGVSLFDFHLVTTNGRCSSAVLNPFMNCFAIPYPQIWTSAVWIKIDRGQIADQFIGVSRLLEISKQPEYAHRILDPHECACIGNVPICAFKWAFFVSDAQESPQYINTKRFDQERFDKILQADKQ